MDIKFKYISNIHVCVAVLHNVKTTQIEQHVLTLVWFILKNGPLQNWSYCFTQFETNILYDINQYLQIGVNIN